MKFGRRLVQVGFMRRYDPAYRAHEGGRDQRRHRRAADDARVAPQPRRARALHQRHGDQRHRRARRRRRPLAARRRGRRRPRSWRRAATATPATCATRCSCCSRWRAAPSSTSRCRSTSRYGYDIRGEIVGETGTVELAESNPVVVKTRGRVRRPGARGLARAVRPRLRHRVPGMARCRRGAGHRHRPQRLGRLRRHGRLRRGAGGAAHAAPGTKVSLRDRPSFYASA